MFTPFNRVLIWGRKVEIIVLLATARVMILLLPFRWLKKTMGDVGVASNVVAEPMALVDDPATLRALQIGRHIAQMAKRMPFKAVCLPQAMVGKWMLVRRRQTSQIFIGVRKGADGNSVDLHAWLMAGGRCITGDRERRGFVEFMQQEPAVARPS